MRTAAEFLAVENDSVSGLQTEINNTEYAIVSEIPSSSTILDSVWCVKYFTSRILYAYSHDITRTKGILFVITRNQYLIFASPSS
jgi:hypothetical protein